MRYKIPAVMTAVILFTLLFAAVHAQTIDNPKSVSEVTLDIVQSGSLYVNGRIDRANLTLFVLQQGEIDVSADGANWRYITDAFGNRLVLIEWSKPSGTIEYSITTQLKNIATYLGNEKSLGNDPKYLAETDSIIFSSEIRKTAYPYERTLKKAAELAIFVNEYMDYDISLVGEQKSSVWAYENRRGVCVEHANLLAALLRLSDISTRYVVGYAYSTIDKKFIGHTWVEVLAGDGSWIPIDPTWLQAGYLDATHIKTANLLDGNQRDTLNYIGSGVINWTRAEERFELIDFKLSEIADVSLAENTFTTNGHGFLKATIKPNGCYIADISPVSCVSVDEPMLDILDKNRKFWLCSETDLYWVFNSANTKTNYVYTCPVSVLDQSGSSTRADITISGESQPVEISISGPSTALVNEVFVLSASAENDFIFFSLPATVYNSKDVSLSFSKTGTYKFYLYSGGSLAERTVNVVEKKSFDLSVSAPLNTTIDKDFIVIVTARNLNNKEMVVPLKIEFDGNVMQNNYMFRPNEEKTLNFNLSFLSSGRKNIDVSLLSDTLTTYSRSIMVYEEKKPFGIIDSILKFFSDIIDGISRGIMDLLGGKK
ncbi:MAG: transglutaminase-like domain-containing protein [Candidatus Aenigmatarchaeota archaeon]